MALNQNKKINAHDINSALPHVDLDVDVVTRLREMQFPSPDTGEVTFVFAVTAGGSEQDDVVIPVKVDPQPGDPAEPIVDDAGEVVVAANEFKAPIPSIDQLRAMPLPTDSGRTFGDLLDEAKANIYLASKALNPEWSDATE
jgi:hypothetical protein